LLPHAARLAGSPHARFFTRGLALSLLQRKPDEWRRQHATPSSGSGANAATSSPDKIKNTRLKATAVAVTPDNDNNKHLKEDTEGGEAGTSLPEKRRGRKKRKRSAAAADGIDALFDDAIGRKVVRSALEPAAAPAPVKAEETNVGMAFKPGRGQSVDHRHAELGAVVDVIRVATRSEGKKRSKRRLRPT
jgi:nucleolar protein 9